MEDGDVGSARRKPGGADRYLATDDDRQPGAGAYRHWRRLSGRPAIAQLHS